MTCRTAAIAGLVAATVMLCRAAGADLPADPFLRCATKALRGDFGRLADWQRAAYQRGLNAGVSTDLRLVVTAYHGGEGRQGQVDRYGRPCTMRTAACNKLPRRSYVWTERWGLRQVLDCGAERNDNCYTADNQLTAFGHAHAHAGWQMGTGLWLDLWFPNARAARRAGCDGWIPQRGAVIQ
jgi:hypothetical protein